MAEVTLSAFPADLVAPAARDGIKVSELERGWTMSPRPQGNRSPQLTLVAVASAIALRGLRRPYPLPPTGHRPPRSAVTMLPARPFDWHLDDPDLSDRAAHRYAIADAFDVPAEIVGLWPAPSRRP